MGSEIAARPAEGTRGQALSRLEQMYAEHAAPATRLAYLMTGDKDLAEDLVQDAFIRMFSRFRHRREPESFGAYLNRTIVNLSRDHFRRRARETRLLESERAAASREQTALSGTTPGRDVEERYALLSLLQALPTRQRAAVVLRHYQDLSERQVADALDCSPGAAKALIARGMEALRAEMEVTER